MATYTLVVTGSDGHQHTTLTDFPDDDAIRADVRDLLSADHPAVAIGRGAGDAVEFLGVWDWSGGDPQWTPDENA